jgi:hypothetical protein
MPTGLASSTVPPRGVGDELLILFARDVLRAHPGATVHQRSQRLYDDVAVCGGHASCGRRAIRRSGEDAETGALLAGDEAHLFSPTISASLARTGCGR